MHFHTNVVEQITGPVQRGPLQPADLEFLMSISADRLANFVPANLEPSNVDLLIGSDYFWSVVDTEKITLPSGLFLVSSKIGYILTGSLDPCLIMSCNDPSQLCCTSDELISIC